MEAIRKEAVTDAIKEECMAAYKQDMSPSNIPLHCASCGERGYDDDVGCKALPLAALGMLKMDEEVQRVYAQLTEEERRTWTVVSHDGQHFHLHESALASEVSKPGDPWYNICRDCKRDMQDNDKLPKYSLKNGCDYGRPVFDFSVLSDMEKVAISRGRLFSHIYIIRHIATGATVSHSLHGHVISFPQDAPSRLSEFPDLRLLSDSVRVLFVGPQTELERIKTDPNLKSSYLRLRSRQLYDALKYLRTVNVLYRDVAIRSEDEIAEACSTAENLLWESIEIDGSEATSKLAQAVSGADVAGVRISNDPESIDSLGNRRYDESLVCPLIPSPSADIAKKSLVVLNDTLVKEKPEPAQHQAQTFHLPRAEEPYNEFLENGKMLMECFPHLFIRGQGATFVKGGLSTRHVLHYLRQFDNRFGTDLKFLFALFNQRQRHLVARAVTARAKRGHDGTFNQLLSIVNRDDFSDRLQKALVDPTCAESREFTRILTAAIKVGGSGIPFSPAEQSMSMGQLYSTILFSGKL